MGGWFAPAISTVSRGKGDASATAKAAYRSGELIHDERTGISHDYRARSGVEAGGMAAPAAAPDWTRDRAALWNAAEKKENRKNSVTARELMAPLPAEVSAEERRQIVEDMAAFLVERYGVAVDWNIHAPNRAGDERNHHAHILFTTRSIGADGWGDKTRVLDESVKKDANGQSIGGGEIEAIRAELAAITNRSLERSGREGDVDHRSYERRGIDREAEPHLGPIATKIERRGEESEKGDERREVHARNEERETLRHEAEIIDLALARIEREERRQQAADQAKERAAEREASRVDREKGRFEEWANARRAEAQSARHDKETEQGRDHQRENLAFEAEHTAQHERTTIWRMELSAIKARQEQPRGAVGRLLYRVTGSASRDRATAKALTVSLEEGAKRHTERRQAMQARHAAERANLTQRHAKIDRQVEQRIKAAESKREREGWQQRSRGAPVSDRDEPTQEAENRPVAAANDLEAAQAPENPEASQQAPQGQREGYYREVTPEEAVQLAAMAEARRSQREAERGRDLDEGRALGG